MTISKAFQVCSTSLKSAASPNRGRRPAAVAEAPDLKESDGIPIEAAGKQAFEASKSPDGRERLAPLRKYRGRLPEGFKFDRLEADECG